MGEKVPALKLQPQTLPFGKLLETIDAYSGSYKLLEENIYNLWASTSRRVKPPSKRNSLRAVIGPSLRHLGLVRGEGNDFRLTGEGKRLVEAFKNGGEAELKKELAVHLVHIDREDWLGILDKLQCAGNNLPISAICHPCCDETMPPGIDEGNLRKYLKFFEYCDPK